MNTPYTKMFFSCKHHLHTQRKKVLNCSSPCLWAGTLTVPTVKVHLSPVPVDKVAFINISMDCNYFIF